MSELAERPATVTRSPELHRRKQGRAVGLKRRCCVRKQRGKTLVCADRNRGGWYRAAWPRLDSGRQRRLDADEVWRRAAATGQRERYGERPVVEKESGEGRSR